jgi:hypothetical protein
MRQSLRSGVDEDRRLLAFGIREAGELEGGGPISARRIGTLAVLTIRTGGIEGAGASFRGRRSRGLRSSTLEQVGDTGARPQLSVVGASSS